MVSDCLGSSYLFYIAFHVKCKHFIFVKSEIVFNFNKKIKNNLRSHLGAKRAGSFN